DHGGDWEPQPDARRWHVVHATAGEEAKHWFAAAFHFNQLLKTEPKNEAYLKRRDHVLSVSLNNVGDMRLKLGDTKAALDSYQQSVDVRRRLAEADPKNPQAQRDLLVSCFNLGNLYQTLDDFVAATRWYGQGLDIARRLPSPDFFKTETTR